MKLWNRLLVPALFVAPMIAAPPGRTQTDTQKVDKKVAVSPEADAQKKNTDAYIVLLRRDVRQEKAEIMGAVLALSAQDAAKFWPIYGEYDVALSKLNDHRVANIKEYAQNYNQMTDEKADELIQKSVEFRKQRAELLANTYDKVKQALGASTAARFAQIEDQLLLIIDLQIVSALPVVGQGS
jgi:hypothetical protein